MNDDLDMQFFNYVTLLGFAATSVAVLAVTVAYEGGRLLARCVTPR